MSYDTDTLTKTISNGAEAYSQGVELQLEAKLYKGLSVFAGFGYNEAKFDVYTATELNASRTGLIEKKYDGHYLPYAPNHTFNLGGQYRSVSGYFARVDLLGTGRFYGDAANTATQDGYEIVNLRVGYERKKLSLYLWSHNVFDEEYLTFVIPYDRQIIGRDGSPRTIGATITWRY